ncbi:hypothetical protein ACFL4Y_00135 [Gemmatimonadota bacterium]
MLAACGAKELTAAEPDPLIGEWIGSFTRLDGTDAGEGSFLLVVRAGGAGTGTGYTAYANADTLLIEELFLQMEIEPSGQVTGNGIWYLIISDLGGFYAEGDVSGLLDPASLTGNGGLTVDAGGSPHTFNWQVTKEGAR